MAINLAVKYSDALQKKFASESFLMNKMNGEHSFEGVKSVTVYTPISKALNDYSRSGIARFGTPTDVADEIQTFTMSKDRGFALIIDKANNSDQLKIKKAGEIMSLQIKEQVAPEVDKHGFKIFALNAGLYALNTAPTKSTIVTVMADALVAMDNAFVPEEGRIFYMPTTYYNMARLSTEVLAIDALSAKALGKGVVAEFMGALIVKVPDTYLPTNVWFICAYKETGFLPVKLETARILTETAGIDGSLLEYHILYDAFVTGAKADGIYVHCATALRVGATTITPTGASHAITNATGSAVIYYTLDGSDPRYSATRAVYASAVTLASGTTIKAVGTKADMAMGAVASATYTA